MHSSAKATPFATIKAYEAISSSGLTAQEIFANCLRGQSSHQGAGLNPISEQTWQFLKEKAPEPLKKSKSTILAATALVSVLEKTGWSADEISDCGFILGTSTGEIDLWEKDLPFLSATESETHPEIYKKRQHIIRHQSLGVLLSDLRGYFKIDGTCSVIASSCSASSQALALAALWIKSGKVKRCLVGTSETLSHLTTTGFESLRLLSKGVCKPFDKNRNGINLGEASAFIALEKPSLSVSLPTYGAIAGVGFSSDAYHATSPDPEGGGCVRSIQQALTSANLSPEQIDWFYAHGTGSHANDLAEAKAIEFLWKENAPLVSSSKPIHGHTLAASGLLESCLALEALQQQQIIPNYFITEADPNFKIPLAQAKSDLKKPLQYILKNSLGFGGINCSLIFSHGAPL